VTDIRTSQTEIIYHDLRSHEVSFSLLADKIPVHSLSLFKHLDNGLQFFCASKQKFVNAKSSMLIREDGQIPICSLEFIPELIDF